jgi:hypothetical protein
MNTIQEFNYDSADRLIKYDVNDYFKLVHNKYYKNINIEFMEYFLSLVSQEDTFCVNQDKLQEYKVLNNIDTSQKILRSLEKFNLKENLDYRVANVGQPVQQGGISIKKVYTLTPHAFKLCLIRAKNSFEYADYYLMLEKVFYYYREYQNQYQTKLLSMKDDKIDRLLEENKLQTQQMKDQSKQMKDQNKQIEELLNYGRTTSTKLDAVQVELHETNEKLDDMQEELLETSEKLDEVQENFDDLQEAVGEIKNAFEDTDNRSVPNPKSEKDRSEFVLLQYKANINKFKFLRGMKEYNDKKIENQYEDEYNLIVRDYNANPMQLFKKFKEIVTEEYKKAKIEIKNNNQLKGKKMRLKREAEKIKFNATNLELKNNYTLDNLLDKLKLISELKFKDYKEVTNDIEIP